MLSRRNFIITNLALLGSNNLLAENIKNKNITNTYFVFLRGGADGLSLLTPYNDPIYNQKRKELVYPVNDLHKINNQWGFHKNLGFLNESYLNNHAVIIPFSGQEDNSRSHFKAEDSLGYGFVNSLQTGFLTRFSEVLDISSIAFSSNVPTALKNSNNNLNIAIDLIDTPIDYSESDYINQKYAKTLTSFNQDAKNITYGNNNNEKMGIYCREKNINLAFMELNGWDTHNAQKERLNGEIHNLNMFLTQFKKGLGNQWNNSLIFIISEFGRCLDINGSGTDHGHGGLFTIVGGKINKSQIITDFKTLETGDYIHENRDMIVEHNYKHIMADLFKQEYSLTPSDINYIFNF